MSSATLDADAAGTREQQLRSHYLTQRPGRRTSPLCEQGLVVGASAPQQRSGSPTAWTRKCALRDQQSGSGVGDAVGVAVGVTVGVAVGVAVGVRVGMGGSLRP